MPHVEIEPKMWKQIVSALEGNFTEAHFVFDQNGMRLLQLDSSKALMVDIKLDQDDFKAYNCDKQYDVCLSMDILSKVNKRIKQSDDVELHFGNGENATLKLFGEMERNFDLRLLTAPDVPKAPTVSTDTKVRIFTTSFKNAVKDVAIFETHITFRADNTQFILSGESSEGDAEIIFRTSDPESPLFEIGGNGAKANYAQEYLKDICKAIDGDDVTIEFSEENPVNITSDLQGGVLKYTLAPRRSRA